MITIRKGKPSEIIEISKILAPAFEDKVMAVIGDEEKAVRIIPKVISSIDGSIFVAQEESNGKKLVGAIIVSVSEIRISFPIVLTCLKVLGFRGSWKAFRIFNDYMKSEPDKLEGEGRLEAVGVLDDNRRNGIGRKLVCRGEEFLREQGLTIYGLGVKPDNPAHGLYLKLGFREVTRYHNTMDHWIYMRKSLKKEE